MRAKRPFLAAALGVMCSVGLHQIPNRRWNAVGWVGYCTRCGRKQTGLHA